MIQCVNCGEQIERCIASPCCFAGWTHPHSSYVHFCTPSAFRIWVESGYLYHSPSMVAYPGFNSFTIDPEKDTGNDR